MVRITADSHVQCEFWVATAMNSQFNLWRMLLLVNSAFLGYQLFLNDRLQLDLFLLVSKLYILGCFLD